jgi:hypothetical protein
MHSFSVTTQHLSGALRLFLSGERVCWRDQVELKFESWLTPFLCDHRQFDPLGIRTVLLVSFPSGHETLIVTYEIIYHIMSTPGEFATYNLLQTDVVSSPILIPRLHLLRLLPPGRLFPCSRAPGQVGTTGRCLAVELASPWNPPGAPEGGIPVDQEPGQALPRGLRRARTTGRGL